MEPIVHILSMSLPLFSCFNKVVATEWREIMKYYLIEVKMGHVGRNKYLPMILPIKATDLDEAIHKAKNHGGVKRNHKDWCLSKPIEVTYADYVKQELLTYSDSYWNNKTKRHLDDFIDRLIDEPHYKRLQDYYSKSVNYKKVKDRESIIYKMKKMTIIIDNGRIKYDRSTLRAISNFH